MKAGAGVGVTIAVGIGIALTMGFGRIFGRRSPVPDPAHYDGAAGYCEALVRAGWKPAGEGVGGRVFHRHGNTDVVKVVDGDRCYMAFADFALAHPSNCLPALRFAHRTEQWAVLHIERLKPLDARNASAFDKWLVAFLASGKAGTSPPPPEAWSTVAASLRKIAISHNCGMDLKMDNVMQRNGTLVFSDPLN